MAELNPGECVSCRTPNVAGGEGVRIPRWKFDLIRSVILAELGEHDVPFSELPERVGARLSADDLKRLGSLGWHAATVKLELEVRDEIRRLPGPGRQMLGLAE